jgi:hypothetical protein
MRKLFIVGIFCLAASLGFIGEAYGQGPKVLLAKGTQPIGWKEFFPDFPAVRLGMSHAAARKAIVRSGVRPVAMPGSVSEIVWNTKFAGIEGRATMLFKPKAGAWEIAVIVYAMERQAELVKSWREKVEHRHGPPTEIHDDDLAVSYVWRFRNKMALEIRAPKDVNSPIVDIHWVQQ